MNSKPESEESIWLLVVSPTIWSVHFLASYLTAAVWCAKFGHSGASLDGVRVAIGIYTLLALLGIAGIGWIGYRRHAAQSARHAQPQHAQPQHAQPQHAEPHDADSAEDRHGFLGFATLLLSALSAVATIFVALVAVFVGSCD